LKLKKHLPILAPLSRSSYCEYDILLMNNVRFPGSGGLSTENFNLLADPKEHVHISLDGQIKRHCALWSPLATHWAGWLLCSLLADCIGSLAVPAPEPGGDTGDSRMWYCCLCKGFLMENRITFSEIYAPCSHFPLTFPRSPCLWLVKDLVLGKSIFILKFPFAVHDTSRLQPRSKFNFACWSIGGGYCVL